MAMNHILKDLLSKIGILGGEEHGKPVPSAKKSSASDYLVKSRELEVFAARVDRILEQRPGVGGNLFLLDFSSTKAKLGPKWDTASDRVHAKIKAIIQKMLSPHDIQFQKDDVTYLLLLPTLGMQEGQLKSSIIAKEVAEALVGADKISSLFKVRTVTTMKNGELVSDETPSITNLLERVSERLNTMPAKPAPQPAQSEPVHAEAPVQPESQPKPKPDAAAALQEFHFVFRPLLAVKTKVISTFLCIPVREDKPGHYVSGYQVLGTDAIPDEIFALDMACLDKVGTELRGLSAARKRSLLALPVHFETLADHKRRVTYVGHCRDKFQELSNRIIFEIIGLPEGVPQPRLLEFVSALRPVGRAVIARFSTDHGEFPAYRVAGLHAVGIEIFGNDLSEAALMKHMDTFVKNAREMQLKSYVEGVRSLSMFTAAITCGFDYIAGYALSGVLGSADDIEEFKLDSLYLSTLQDLDRLPRA